MVQRGENGTPAAPAAGRSSGGRTRAHADQPAEHSDHVAHRRDSPAAGADLCGHAALSLGGARRLRGGLRHRLLRRLFRPSHEADLAARTFRSEEHTSELQSLMRISYAVFCLNKKTIHTNK